MNKKYDDFFEDLDKTTDLLKTFKPRVSNDKSLEDIELLYKELNKNKNKKDNKIAADLEKKQKLEEVKKIIKEEQIARGSSIQPKKGKPTKTTDISEIMNKIDSSIKQKKVKQTNKNLVKTNSELKKERTNSKKEKNKQAKKNPKSGIFEIIFCSFSLLFILGCMVFYGSRLVKYYKIYNPKSKSGDSLTLLSVAIAKNSPLVYEGDGLYMQNGEYTYKGSELNNYIKFSNMLWRIIKVNTDGSVDLVLDDYINALSWANRAKPYIESDVHKYLNNYFIKYLNKDYLAETTICKDEVNDLKKFSCNNRNEENYVRLLSVSDFLNSQTETSFISGAKDTIWLNTVSDKKTWQINGNNLSLADPARALSIKPVIRLKSGIALLKGAGSEKDPYIIETEKQQLAVGDYVSLGKDVYVIYDIDEDNLSLALNNFIDVTYRYDLSKNIYSLDTKNSLAYYLNNNYYNSLSYKNLLIEKQWNTGVYLTSYEDITKSTLKAKVGLLDMANLKFNNKLQDYFILNGINKNVYLYGNELVSTKPAIYRHIRPAISIKKSKILNGDGSLDKPYILED